MRKLKLRGELTERFFFIVKRSSTSYRVGKKFSPARMRGFVSSIYDLYRGAKSNHVPSRKLQATNQKLTAKSAHDRGIESQSSVTYTMISDDNLKKRI